VTVNVLFCEGYQGKYDVRLLQVLLVGTGCTPIPAGGKDNLSTGVRMVRTIRSTGGQGIFALRDRDFDMDKSIPLGQLRTWIIQDQNNNIDLGWTWERREIENYLLDPIVVERALPVGRINIKSYNQELDQAADRLGYYTAARTAISLSRRAEGLKNVFSPYQTAEQCRQKIHEILENYLANSPNESEILEKFEDLQPECLKGGVRHSYFLTFFSGKNLFTELNSSLRRAGFNNQNQFVEEVLEGIKNATEDVWEWLPEWVDLRQQILTKNP
jgi:hypothetical protein